MTNKQIIDAQRVLKRLEGTPVRVDREHGQTVWQVTYDDNTYNALLGVIDAVAHIPLKEYLPPYQPPADYHRDRI